MCSQKRTKSTLTQQFTAGANRRKGRKMEIIVLHGEVKSLEDEVILEIVKQHPDRATAYSLERELVKSELPSFTDAYYPMNNKIREICCISFAIGKDVLVLDSVPFDHLDKDIAINVIRISREASICPLIQVAALLHHRLTRFEMLVATYATDGVTGLIEAGATQTERDYIYFRDRLARSILARDAVNSIPTRAEVKKSSDDGEDCYI